eukprot:scaffold85666_cov26-Tisochrysis_lutea.AAC.5
MSFMKAVRALERFDIRAAFSTRNFASEGLRRLSPSFHFAARACLPRRPQSGSLDERWRRLL